MHPRLLELYNEELGYVREMGTEFARQFPKIAGRLALDSTEVADPYVERLFEGFAFLAARVQLKIEAEFPRFVQHLMEVTYPGLIAPVPSMAIARLQPDPAESNLARGVVVPRGAALQSVHVRGAQTRCQFRTAHDVTLWPLRVASVQYFSFAPDLPLTQLPAAAPGASPVVRGGLRIRLRGFEGVRLRELPLDRLTFFLSAPDNPAFRLYELIFASALGALVLPTEQPAPWFEWCGPQSLHPVGFTEDEALLPPARSGFRGNRLLQEYAALPQRFLFFEVTGLARAMARMRGDEFEIVLPFERGDPTLESLIDSCSVSLHCTPIVNLFPKRLDRVQVTEGAWEFHVVPDRARPVDFEVYRIEQVTAFGGASFGEQRFHPLYSTFHHESPETRAFFSMRREPRLLSPTQRQEGPRSAYRGSEVFVALVDQLEAPYSDDIRQLAIEALVSNRDLPLLLPTGVVEAAGQAQEHASGRPSDRSSEQASERNDFVLETTAPVLAIQCLRGPTRPHVARDQGEYAWDLISQLNLNYLSLIDASEREGAAALRSILTLYASDDAALRKQLEGIVSVDARRSVRRLPFPGPLTFGAGVEISLLCDELAFQGGSIFLLGAVLERFFTRHAGINSFVELVLRSVTRGEVMRWRPRPGSRPLL